jgi:hypothetical protein
MRDIVDSILEKEAGGRSRGGKLKFEKAGNWHM